MLANDFVLDLEKFEAGFMRKSEAELAYIMEVAKNEGVGDPRAFLRGQLGEIKLFRRMMEGAQRFVLSPMVVEASDDFADDRKVVQSALDYIFLPAEITWIEWQDGRSGDGKTHRHGLLFIGQGEGHAALSCGQAAYVYDNPNMSQDVQSRTFNFDLHSTSFSPVYSKAPADEKALIQRLGKFIVCVLALINTPRVSRVIHHEVDSALNRARVRRGKTPYLSWSDVTIRPDIGWVPRSVEETGETGERRRHHVRTFMRLKRGRVEIVRPHWRGNAERGYKMHRHVVRMDGEEAGPWKGSPNPGPRILHEDDPLPEVGE